MPKHRTKPKPPNIVDVIVSDIIDGAPMPLGIDLFSQGQAAERRRIRELLRSMHLNSSGLDGTMPAIGLDDIGGALAQTSKSMMSDQEFDICIKYANRLMKRFAARRINAGQVLAVCGMILMVAGEIQKDVIASSDKSSKQ